MSVNVPYPCTTTLPKHSSVARRGVDHFVDSRPDGCRSVKQSASEPAGDGWPVKSIRQSDVCGQPAAMSVVSCRSLSGERMTTFEETITPGLLSLVRGPASPAVSHSPSPAISARDLCLPSPAISAWNLCLHPLQFVHGTSVFHPRRFLHGTSVFHPRRFLHGTCVRGRAACGSDDLCRQECRF